MDVRMFNVVRKAVDIFVVEMAQIYSVLRVALCRRTWPSFHRRERGNEGNGVHSVGEVIVIPGSIAVIVSGETRAYYGSIGIWSRLAKNPRDVGDHEQRLPFELSRRERIITKTLTQFCHLAVADALGDGAAVFHPSRSAKQLNSIMGHSRAEGMSYDREPRLGTGGCTVLDDTVGQLRGHAVPNDLTDQRKLVEPSVERVCGEPGVWFRQVHETIRHRGNIVGCRTREPIVYQTFSERIPGGSDLLEYFVVTNLDTFQALRQGIGTRAAWKSV